MENKTDNLPAIFSGSLATSPAQQVRGVPIDQEEANIPISHYLWVIRQNIPKILIFMLTSLMVTYLISKRLQPIYEATATINIDRQAPTGVIGDQSRVSAEGDSDEFIATQMKIMQADSVLRPVAEKYGLLEREGQLSQPTPSARKAHQDQPTKLGRLNVTRPPNTYLVLVSYRSTNSQLSADVANAVAKSYVEHIFRIQTASATSASGFMTTQLDELKARMERSSQALAQFEKELNVISPEEKTNIMTQRLLQLNSEYTTAQADRVRKEANFNSIKTGSLEAVQISGQGDSLARVQERINEAQEKFAEIKASKGPNHPDYKKAQLQLAELTQQFNSLRENIAQRIEVDYNQSVNREQMLQKALDQTKADFDHLNAHSFDYQQLKQEADADKKLYEELVTKIQEAGINSGFQNKNTVISDLARPEASPIFPNLTLNLLIAGILSLLLGVATAILTDSLDASINPEEIQRLYQSELLGTLPIVKDARTLLRRGIADESPSTALSTTKAPDGAGSAPFDEGVRMLRNSILLSDFNRSIRSLLFTSATPGEGKSTIAMHLAMAHAQQGKKTLLIDADLRRPTLDKKLNIAVAGPGLSGVILGELSWDEALLQIPSQPNLYFMPAGAASRKVSDVIGSGITDLIDEAVRVYDLVLIDAPPILGFAEPMQIAIAVDGVVLIAVAGETNRKAVSMVVGTLRRLGANLLGIVLNRTSKNHKGGYYYYTYDYNYRYYNLRGTKGDA
jgi:polysaccharide biosynthesis transport protein